MSTINPSVKFGEKDDFGRKEIADKLIKLLLSEKSPDTLMIDGNWGIGKTEFTYKTINRIKSDHDKVKVIYFNAFAEDYMDNPFFSLMSKIYEVTKQDELKKTLINSFRFFEGKSGIVGMVLNAVEKATGSPLPGAVASSVFSVTKQALQFVDKEISSFKETMNSLVTKLRMETATAPLWIFVDELDRCRPNYALSVMEIVKHFVEGTGIRVVYVANSKQLQTSIRHAYGSDINAAEYLRKFVQWRLELPIGEDLNDNARRYVLSMFPDDDSTTYSTGFRLIDYVFRKNKHSLRDAEDFSRAYNIMSTLLNYSLHHEIAVVALYLNMFHPSLMKLYEKSPRDNRIPKMLEEVFPNINDIDNIPDEDTDAVTALLKIFNESNVRSFRGKESTELGDFAQGIRSLML